MIDKKPYKNGPQIVTSHFTRRGAQRKSQKLEARRKREAGKSSGWQRFDYSVSRKSGLRPWKVVMR